MKKLLALVPLILILIFLFSQSGCQGITYSSGNSQSNIRTETDRFIVHLKPGVSLTRMQPVYQQIGAALKEDIPRINSQVIEIPTDPIINLNNLNEIDYVEPDSEVKAQEISDDPDFARQWGLAKIQAPASWQITHSSSTIKIAVLDSGIDIAHPDLVGKVVAAKNFTDSQTTEDIYGHGTHVAGIIAGITNNAIGIAGVAYNASLMDVKVLGDNGGGAYSWIIQGVIWAADNGANVINMSMDGYVDSPAWRQAVDYAWSKGAVVVAAAGNNGKSTPTYPASYENCIAVAATDPDDKLYSFSDYGDWVDVAAPGSAISTMVGNKYGVMTGTSMAAPFVSGLAGLAFAVAMDTNGDGKRNDEVRNAIQNGADRVSVSGTGSGRINAYKTISSLLSVPSTVR